MLILIATTVKSFIFVDKRCHIHQLHLINYFFYDLQMTQRDILNSIDREMSGHLAAGLKCIGKSFLQVASYCSLPFFPPLPQIIFNSTYKSRFWPHIKCWNFLQYNVHGNLQNTLLIDCGIPQRELEPMTPPWFELLFPVLKWVFTFLVDVLRLTSPGMWLRNPLQTGFKVWVSNNSTNVLRSFVVTVVINRGTQQLLA